MFAENNDKISKEQWNNGNLNNHMNNIGDIVTTKVLPNVYDDLHTE